MTKFKDVTVADLAGACAQWKDFIAQKLRYDYAITVEAGIADGKGKVWLHGCDKFQEKDRYTERHVGKLAISDYFELSDSWEQVCKQVWDKLNSTMQRDERELRYGLNVASGVLDMKDSFESKVGQMLAQRISDLRDELGKNLIEFRKEGK